MNAAAITQDLVRAAQAGDRQALERVLERYYDRVRRAVGIRMGARVRSWTDSVDIMTRTFLKALEKFDAFEMRDESSLLRWLVKIAEGMIRDAADERNAGRRNPDREAPLEYVSPSGTAVQAPLPDPAASLTRAIGRNEDKELVDAALAALAEADRELLLQYYYLDMTWEEIAAEAGELASDADKPARERAAEVVRKRAAVARARLAVELQRRRHGGAAADAGAS
ncbi:MAG: sigma-70 family RNA polymerase sigma factor [Planctomycetes bacterium]|nr:sigma-70 family RNA polymerase sigma factor [Planctomycetota bacterium]